MALNPADIAVVSQLLDQALALPAEERQAWLAALPSEHQRHLETLRDMLVQEAGLEADLRLGSMPTLPMDESVAREGDRVGPYRLIKEIGRGGMGSVWLAERADGAYKRQVALKLPRLAWGAGLAERMAREREIGMLLEHPNIARLYDAGVDDRGRPFLALEFVDGQPIDAWCEAQRLNVRDRLRLFVPVIRAVGYAHGRLVVHRDLKPSNVLVTPDGQVHLLDFGIAKLLLDAAPGEPGLTQEQGRVLTPHYASPEQVAGEAITVQSDVYSLGVLLYELLTGKLPIEPKRSSIGAVEEAILQGDAPLASNRVKERSTVKTLRGEIDAILGKAMQREPARRYLTAEAMKLDIERYLQGETVSARPDSAGYRLKKAIRRNWIGVSAGAAVLVAIVAGSAVAVIQSRRAAESAEQARVVRDFVTEVFRMNTGASSDSDSLRQLPAEKLLAHGAKLIEARFPRQPVMRAELLGVVGGIYAEMGAYRLAADFTSRQLSALEEMNSGRDERVQVVLRLSEALLNDSKPTEALKLAGDALKWAEGNIALTYDALVMLLRCQRRTDAREVAKQTLRRVQALEQTSEFTTHASRAWVLAVEAAFYSDDNRWEQAIATYELAISAAKLAEGPRSMTASLIQLQTGKFLMSLNRWDQAQAYIEPALAALRAMGPSGGARALYESVNIKWMQGQYGLISSVQAASAIANGLSELRKLGPSLPGEIIANLEINQALMEMQGGSLDNVSRLLDRTEALMRASPARGDLFFWTFAAATFASMSGRHESADSLYREGLKLRLETGSGGVKFAVVDQARVAGNLIMQGRSNDAEAFLDSTPQIEPVRGDPIAGAYYSMMLFEMRAKSRLERGDPSGALRLLSDKADTAVKWDDGSTPPESNPNASRGILWCQVDQSEKGLRFLNAAIDLRVRYAFAHDPGLAWMRAHAGLCVLRSGNYGSATRLAMLAREAFVRQPGVSPYYKAPLFKLERALGLKLPPL